MCFTAAGLLAFVSASYPPPAISLCTHTGAGAPEQPAPLPSPAALPQVPGHPASGLMLP